MKYNIFYKMGFIVLMLLVFVGCSQLQPTQPKLIDTLVIKNDSGKHIKVVAISEVTLSGQGRYGSISPVPAGMDQVYGRGENAERLSDELRISWIDSENRLFEKTLSTASLLISKQRKKSVVVVIVFGPYNSVGIYQR